MTTPGAALLGALCAAGWLTRPTGFLLGPVVLAVCLADARGAGRPRRAVHLAVLALFALAPVILWIVYQVGHGMPVKVSGAASAANLYKGNNEAVPHIYPYIDLDSLEPFMERLRDDWRRRGLDPDDRFLIKAIRFASSSPARTLDLIGRKAIAFLVPARFPLGSGRARLGPGGVWRIDGYRPFHPANHIVGLSALPGILVALLAPFRRRRLSPPVLFASGLFLLTMLIHLATFAETRFRLPFDPILAASAAVALAATVPSRKEPPAPGSAPLSSTTAR